MTRGFICGKLILGLCSLYGSSALLMSRCHRPLNKPASALVCLLFCRYLKAVLSQLETAARRLELNGHSHQSTLVTHLAVARTLPCPLRFAEGCLGSVPQPRQHEVMSIVFGSSH